MKRVLYCILLIAWPFTGFVQPVVMDQPEVECHADFAATPDPGDPMTLHFQDLSTGRINHWQWSFGDGVTSAQQNPVHTYLAGGTYFACLTVYNSDSGWICHDMICIPVTIHEPGQCVADYLYSVDAENHLKLQFTDKSSGTINGWHWDFGDGTVSGDQNPVHTFPYDGNYKVCLTAYDAGSPSTCSDIKCDSIELKVISDCKASFEYVLDSMNQNPNTFFFTDQSYGNANDFRWTFDDGAVEYRRNVVHQFTTPGTHQVCQIIKRFEQGNLLCSDSSCTLISTAKYLDLGGHLFAGKYPINNPVPSGDTGIAYLFKQTATGLKAFDTVCFTYLGYFSFPQILNGEYMIRAELSVGSANYGIYFPSYYPKGMVWTDSPVITLVDSNIFKANINLNPVKILTVGSGIIRGSVSKVIIGEPNQPVPGAEVMLYGEDMTPLTFTKADNEGLFEFSMLPLGAYNLYVEYPGKHSRLTAVWIDEQNPVQEALCLELFDHNVTGIAEMQDRRFRITALYPNPVVSDLRVSVSATIPGRLIYRIIDVTGNSYRTGIMEYVPGLQYLVIPVKELPNGLYLIDFRTLEGERISTHKLVKLY